MTSALTQLDIARVTEAYWRVTFRHPPINLVDPDTLTQLQQLVGQIEADPHLKVVVFDSANPDFYLARYDLSRAAETPVAPGPTGLPTWIDLTTRLSQTRVVSIASVRGRARGAGSEFTLACDLRFASLEKALFGQPEVPAGIIPGGGALERLPRLVGRARALEIVLGGDDFDASTAERYGWINRAVPDAELDAFVDTFARRIASFDAQALGEAKRLVNRTGLPSAADLLETQTTFFSALHWPGARTRGAKARELSAAQPRDFELRLGHHLGQLGSSTP
ncbi:enoyl-CoA hydratase/isomerase family protein [Stigmatella sp. ncwal1]|uniref:Enoyl-CoA hydratase/isomerase family protein n=1 Tax=Stigmatella ashevillensis TaxID=2995309 RepID=A0ABT5DHV5_9BACT|nr:enoyl-CoA hydratase/isomerase family protein [Stigmatella ashevillena]MDC0711946.1 enoyl-CoA hydratase/isomerase family protein [Stigmatella ashevillena]